MPGLRRHQECFTLAGILHDVMNHVSQELWAGDLPALAPQPLPQRKRAFAGSYPERASHERGESPPSRRDVNCGHDASKVDAEAQPKRHDAAQDEIRSTDSGELTHLICFARGLWLATLLASLAACGGGGDDGPLSPPDQGWVAGVFEPASRFDAECAAPRSGSDPDGDPWPDVQGTALDEKNWLRSWTHDLYLWYREVPDVNPEPYSVIDYFDLLKTSELTPSGNPKDKFHFTFPTDEWLALSQSGELIGYGLQWAVVSSLPPREVVVAYTDPGSPAEMAPANLTRGAKVLKVDGVGIDEDTQAAVDTLNAGLFPEESGESHTFLIEDLGGGTRNVTLTTANVTSTPVQNVHTIPTGSGPVGYMLFNDHIATAEAQLVQAIETLRDDGIVDLVLDIRYNGGGYLAIASELAYMIAGTSSADETFETLEFNDQHRTTNPVTGQALTPLPFLDTSQGFSGPAGQSLPTLNLPRVFVLTGPNTCSASESIINSLRGINVEVIQIGSTTCG